MAEVVNTNEFKNGMHIEHKGSVWRIVEFQHVKPGKGGAFVRTKLKGLDSGAVVDETFRAGEKFARVHTQVRNVQFLYDDGGEAHFMDEESFEQFGLPHAEVEDELAYMLPSGSVQMLYVNGKPSGIQLPASVELARHGHRAGGARRHRLQRDEAGHARDGRGRAGAAVRQRGRPHQGRSPRSPVHQPSLTATGLRRVACAPTDAAAMSR